MGRHGLPLARQREAPGRQRISLADPPQEAEGQADAEAHRTGEWDQVEGAGCRRACVRAREGGHGLVVRTIGLARARVKIGLANLVYNMKRALWLTERRA